MRRIAVINQKGGVGKTTTSVNLAHALAMVGRSIGRRVLAVDLDPQGHMATSLGIHGVDRGLDAVFRGEAQLAEVMVEARENLDLVTPGVTLNDFEGLDETVAADTQRLSRALDGVSDYDFAIIDCPPSSGQLGMNGMLAADEILIPVPGDYLAMVGLSSLLTMLEKVEEERGRHFLKWIVVTRFDSRRNHAHEVFGKLREYFPEQLLDTVISESVALTESPSFGQTIFEHQGNSRSASEYAGLARDLVQAINQTRKSA
ncbi:ParA family protein [Mangrovimicrobium sediminis]|uniref:ParA family protein n=1 Tax=Mangrovimicrobium sediminis TaxID=2562682 RepID=A0A4Z0M0W3_9GAMM|nr:ParA family protein [Haliea sp. SAOS-164]TGD73171.1 ParA family protein [Haliea sp. SAOS-164]